MTTETSYGPQIRRARINLGWSREDLARRVGVSGETIRTYEREIRKPSLQTVIRLEQELSIGLSLDKNELRNSSRPRLFQVKDLEAPEDYVESEIYHKIAKMTPNQRLALYILLNNQF